MKTPLKRLISSVGLTCGTPLGPQYHSTGGPLRIHPSNKAREQKCHFHGFPHLLVPACPAWSASSSASAESGQIGQLVLIKGCVWGSGDSSEQEKTSVLIANGDLRLFQRDDMSLVPAGFVPNLVYQTRNLSDGDCVGGIGYSPDLSISLVCVRAAPASAAAEQQLQSSRPSNANPPAAAQTASASPAAADGSASHATAGPATEPPLSSTTASLPTPSAAAVREGSRVRIEGLQAKPKPKEWCAAPSMRKAGDGRLRLPPMRLVPLASVPFAQPTFL
jgi:hypothetical protein